MWLDYEFRFEIKKAQVIHPQAITQDLRQYRASYLRQYLKTL